MLVNFYIIIVYLFVCEQILNFLMQNVEYGPSKRIKKMSLMVKSGSLGDNVLQQRILLIMTRYFGLLVIG